MPRILTVGSLFAGIGGFDLGFEMAGGFEIVWQVEIDAFCRSVLERHWPDAKRYADIRTVADIERVDVVCGGFPCQDISNAGTRTGIDGDRSGLWTEFARIVRMVRPRYVIVENVAALLQRGISRVLGDLAAIRYDAEWQCIRASDIGAPHRRNRLWIVAYPMADTDRKRCERERTPHDDDGRESRGNDADRRRAAIPHAVFTRSQGDVSGQLALTECRRSYTDPARSTGWATEPAVRRVADGFSVAMDRPRLRGLGNAVVPQIVAFIAQRIVEREKFLERRGCFECDDTGFCNCIVCGRDTADGRVAGPCAACKGRAFYERNALALDPFDPRDPANWERHPAADGNRGYRVFIPAKGLK